MKNMYDVFKKLKKVYKDYDISFDDTYDYIIISNDMFKITCDDSVITLYIKNKEITHKHLKNRQYDYIYNLIIDFIDNYDKIKKRQEQVNVLLIFITIVIGIIILVFV